MVVGVSMRGAAPFSILHAVCASSIFVCERKVCACNISATVHHSPGAETRTAACFNMSKEMSRGSTGAGGHSRGGGV